MSNFPGSFNPIPLWAFIVVPLLFIGIALFTDWRYDLRPNDYIGNSTVFASLVIGFIFLYAMQKYDTMDLNVPVVYRNLIYLKAIAEKYNPKLIDKLIQYAEGFLDFDKNDFSIQTFEWDILPLIDDPNLVISVHESVNKLSEIYDQRVSGANLIAEPIWYLVFICALLLTLIFPLDTTFEKPMDSVLVIVLIWLPLVTIYAIYNHEIDNLENTINETIKILKSPDTPLTA